ncbi:AmmeMemoRadiSam system protein B [Trichlorobacter sp.]|nr:AmmeMemoRadiSam system protein B [Trichlorobacter sp.]
MLVVAKELGASKAELVAYATSGEVTGDYQQVVAYAAVTVF